MSFARSWVQRITTPSSRHALGTLVFVGIVLGAVGVVGFNVSMKATNANDFCLSCHELAENAGKEFEGTPAPHQLDRQAGHLRRLPRASRVRAEDVAKDPCCRRDLPPSEGNHRHAREVRRAPHVDGVEDLGLHERERLARVPQLPRAKYAWKLELQSEKAQEYHSGALAKGKTCIDCHKGLAHKLPPGIREDAQIEGIDF